MLKHARFYLHHKFLYSCIWGVFLGVVVCFSVYITRNTAVSNLISAVAVILFVADLLSVQTYIQSLTKLLTNQCDPVTYLQKTDALLAGLDLSKKITNGIRNAECTMILCNRNTAFCDLGRYEEANEIFRFLQSCAGEKLLPTQMTVVYHNLAFAYAQKGELSLARYYADAEHQTWSFCKPIGKNAKALRWFDETSTAAFLFQKQGELQAAFDLYAQLEAFLQTQKKTYYSARVGIAFELGELYFRVGNFSEALPRLQFVAQNGGTTFYRAEAEKILAEIQ